VSSPAPDPHSWLSLSISLSDMRPPRGLWKICAGHMTAVLTGHVKSVSPPCAQQKRVLMSLESALY
jgi:hypothetical protein